MTTPTLTDTALLREVFRYARSKGWRRDHDILYRRHGEKYWMDDRETTIHFDGRAWLDIASVCNFEVITVGLAVDVLVAFGVLPTRFCSAYRAELVDHRRAEIERLTDKLRLLRDAVDDLTRWEDGEERDSVPVVEIKDVLDGWVPVRLATPAPADATPEAEPCRCDVDDDGDVMLWHPSPDCQEHADAIGPLAIRCRKCNASPGVWCQRVRGGSYNIVGWFHAARRDDAAKLPAAPAAAGADQGEAQGGEGRG